MKPQKKKIVETIEILYFVWKLSFRSELMDSYL